MKWLVRIEKKGSGSLLKVGKYYHLQYMVNGAVKRISLQCTSEREAHKKADELLPALQAKTKKIREEKMSSR